MLRKIIKWIPFFLLYIPFKIFSLQKNSDKQILLFGTGTGLYHDNSKYLFEYVLKNAQKYPEYIAYWVTSNKTTFMKLKNKGKPVLYKNSLECVKKVAQAKALFLTSGLLDIFWFVNSQTTVIQLWHGTPIKKIGFDTPIDTKRLEKTKNTFGKDYQFDRYNYLIIEDKKYSEIFQSAFQIPETKILCLGQARNTIFQNSNKKRKAIKDYLNILHYNKIILYAPTFRDDKQANIKLLKQLINEKNNQYLKANNDCLLIKVHPFLAYDKEIIDYVNKYNENIILVINMIDIQELLLVSDAVVTDISSLALDYLQYSNNLYSFFPDEEQYIKVRGSFYDVTYNELTANSNKISSLDKITFNNMEFRTYNKEAVCKEILKLI